MGVHISPGNAFWEAPKTAASEKNAFSQTLERLLGGFC